MNSRYLLSFLFVAAGIFMLTSCEDESHESAFSYFNAAGTWIIYEIESQNGSVDTGD
ncbi:MAG TPA: hypothetical protein VK589_23285 [Chryseolinea sp.]|nr:hypothetical protein [Chryseolinea sp.]